MVESASTQEAAVATATYNKYTLITKKFLNFVWLWPRDDGSYSARNSVLIFLSSANLIMLLGFEIWNIYSFSESFSEALEISCNTTASMAVFSRIAGFIFKRKNILRFDREIHKMWTEEFDFEENRETMIKDATATRRLIRMFQCLLIFAMTNMMLGPAVSAYLQWRSGVPPEEIVYVLPFLIKFPLDLRKPVSHALSYVPITICYVNIISWIGGIDGFYLLGIRHVILHLKLLVQALGRLRGLQGDQALLELQVCIAKHERILRMGNMMDQAYGPIILGFNLFNTLSMCLVLFNVAVTKGGRSGNLVLFGSYFTVEVTFVLIYCYFGDNIIEESKKVCHAAFDVDWFQERSNALSISRCIQIMMARAQKPITITVYNFADVSLELFTSIMSSTASYFAVLRTLYRQ